MISPQPSSAGTPTDLGKGLFGYRRSAVEQLIADRDHLLTEAENRMRATEARITELETALAQAERQKADLDERLTTMQSQLEILSARSVGVERLAGRVRAEAERVSAWRKRLQTVATLMTPSVERFRLLLEQVPERVQEALSPVAVNAPSVMARLEELAAINTRLETEPPEPSP